MMHSKTDSLKAAWKQWCDILSQQEILFPRRNKETLSNPDGLQALHRTLLPFSDEHSASSDHLQSVLIALSKGKHLVEAALAWDQPNVGPSGKAASNRTSRARGEQWRLVMAYGGFETVLEALTPVEPNEECLKRLLRFTDCCALLPFKPLRSPNCQLAELARWLGAEETSSRHPMMHFLGMNKRDAEVFRSWVIEGRSVDNWPLALRLSKVLRNATAHGALSASKVLRWGLQAAFGILTDNLGTVVAAAIHLLGKSMPLNSLSTQEV